jgi:1-carboxybiuret hydrolase subunit AtzG-like
MTEADDKTLDALIEAAAKALALPLDPAWMPAVRGNLRVTLGHAATVAGLALPDELEPAPIFRA